MAATVSLEKNSCVRIVCKINYLKLKGKFESEPFGLFGVLWKFIIHHDGYHKIHLVKDDWSKLHEPFSLTSYMDVPEQSLKFLVHAAKIEKREWNIKIWERTYVGELAAEDENLLSGVVTFVVLCAPIEDCSERDNKETQTLTIMDITNGDCLNCLSLDFLKFFEDCAQPDIELKCKDVTMPAHRTILSARSPVFAAMLRTDMAENLKGCIDILDIRPSILQQLLKYIYCAKLDDLSEETAPYLYAAADKYAIEPLKKQCANFMVEHLTKENACSHLVLSDAHSDGDFKEAVISFIVDKEELIMEASWQNFCKNCPMLACEVFNRVFMKKCSTQDHSSEH